MIRIYKGGAVGPTEAVLMRPVSHFIGRSEGTRRVEMISSMVDLERGPHIPRSVVGLWRLLAYCAVCQETVAHLPTHVMKGEHDIRCILLPDFRRGA